VINNLMFLFVLEQS